jgi:transporter family-2 protein
VAKSSAWSWTGGVFGTIYIVVSILLLPHLGAATVVALLVTGQMLGSLVFDHYGSVSRHTRSTFSALPARRC